MALTRREWLKRVLGAAAAAAVAPLIDLTDPTPAFWNQAPLKSLLAERWKVTFPSGETYTFDATVVGEKLLADGTVSLTVKVISPVGITGGQEPESVDEEDVDAHYVGLLEESEGGPAVPASGTTLSVDGKVVAELMEVEVASLERQDVDPTEYGDDYVIPGLKRQSELSFVVRFNNEEDR